MPRFRRIPLAYKNLTHDYRRLAVAVGGIGFAVLLMFMQTGFRFALLDSTVAVIDDLNADLIIASRAKFALPSEQRFPRQRLVQAESCPGVAAAAPLYVENPVAVLRRPGDKGHPIRVLAFPEGEPVFAIPQVAQRAEELERPFTALIDRESKSKFGVPVDDLEKLRNHRAELSGRRIRFIGAFSMGTDFANDGNVIMTARNFTRYFPFRARGNDPLSIVDLGVVRVQEGAEPAAVKERLAGLLPDDVRVFTKSEFRDAETEFWRTSTPVGYIFGVGMALGFVVGVIICYQIIYASISSHMPEFATLKAMGYRDRYFISLVVFESVYLSVLGFVPGLLVSWLLYAVLAEWTGLLMLLTPPRAALVYLFTVAMCVTSGCLAMRRALAADPAELF
ncbi:MAG: ABC transporter permease DevC [Planctomycetes bacterium]|nr:ABC transporter permease DevC [Planctomycetota bacterium]